MHGCQQELSLQMRGSWCVEVRHMRGLSRACDSGGQQACRWSLSSDMIFSSQLAGAPAGGNMAGMLPDTCLCCPQSQQVQLSCSPIQLRQRGSTESRHADRPSATHIQTPESLLQSVIRPRLAPRL